MRGFNGLDKDPVYLSMELAGKKLPCLLDSGCDVTLVPKTIIDTAKRLRIVPSTQHLFAANDIEIEITGAVTLPLKLNGRCIKTRALITADVDEMMLGADWLHEHNCIRDFAKRQIYVDGCAAVPVANRRAIRCRRVFLQVCFFHQVRPGLYVGRTLLSTGHRDLKVRMINTTSNTQRLFSGTCIGALSPVDVVNDVTGDCDNTLSDTRGARNDTAPGDASRRLDCRTAPTGDRSVAGIRRYLL